jgi:tellurite resistance protein TehA-like permease
MTKVGFVIFFIVFALVYYYLMLFFQAQFLKVDVPSLAIQSLISSSIATALLVFKKKSKKESVQ